MVSVLLTSAKMGTIGLLKIRVFGNESYDVIILSRYPNYIVDVVM